MSWIRNSWSIIPLRWPNQSRHWIRWTVFAVLAFDIIDRGRSFSDLFSSVGAHPSSVGWSLNQHPLLAYLDPFFWLASDSFQLLLLGLQMMAVLIAVVRPQWRWPLWAAFYLQVGWLQAHPLTHYGGDSLLSVLLLYLVLVQLCEGVADPFLAIMILTIYWIAAMTKVQSPWIWGDAIDLIVASERETRIWWAHSEWIRWPIVAKAVHWFSLVASPTVVIAEFVVPPLALFSRRWGKACSLVMMAFHLVLAVFFELSFFPYLAAGLWWAASLRWQGENSNASVRAARPLVALGALLLVVGAEMRFLWTYNSYPPGILDAFHIAMIDRSWTFWGGHFREGSRPLFLNVTGQTAEGKTLTFLERPYPNHRWHHLTEALFLSHAPVVWDHSAYAQFHLFFCRKSPDLKAVATSRYLIFEGEKDYRLSRQYLMDCRTQRWQSSTIAE